MSSSLQPAALSAGTGAAAAPETGNELAIRVKRLRKGYQIYEAPRDRLKQFVLPRLQRLVGRHPRQYFREFLALKDVSLDVRKGETIGIVGRNGSGKSTLLQIICGTLYPNSGDVEVRGRVAALLELGSGFNPEFTGRENVYLNASVLGLTTRQIDARFADIVVFADIGDFIDQPVKTYSSGMTVRLAFAVIAHVDADILVIDEALAVGDAFFTQKCMRFLRNFMKTGTVLFVSHDTASIKSLCNRAIWLERGEVLQEGEPKDVCDRYLEAFFEAQQGGSTTTKLREAKSRAELPPRKDQRLEMVNASNLRNDLQVFAFDPDAASFGKGGARIESVEILDTVGAPLRWVVGGEQITLRIGVQVAESLNSPIVGFFVKDRLGQTLFGDNTYLSYLDEPVPCAPGSELQATFTFAMPILPPGDYSVNVAVADGTHEQHIQHHWIHDAIMFRSESSSIVTGLVGIPMQEIELNVMERARG
jgi:lipopolysaccharide transport system ATP-binding protein